MGQKSEGWSWLSGWPEQARAREAWALAAVPSK